MSVSRIVVGGRTLSVGESIGKGGEGEVFRIAGQDGLAVKVYNAALRARRLSKVEAMVRQGLANRSQLVAFPIQMAHDSGGRFVGFVMRLVSGHRPLHQIYSPKSRLKYFPKADYRFLVRVASNLARAVGSVHQSGCVIGDLNHSGVLVSHSATVALIDADSFQLRVASVLHRCMVGVPDFTPPELHRVNLGSVERTPSHDHFGLAVGIFHLLFMGRHPYAGRHSGPDFSMGEAIEQNRFAYSIARADTTRTTPPPGAPRLDRFPAEIVVLFERAFGLRPESRPSAAEWIAGLAGLEKTLRQCRIQPSHFFPTAAKTCLWCDLTSSSNFELFPHFATGGAVPSADAQGTDRAIRLILSFRFPTLDQLLPPPGTVAQNGSAALKSAQQDVSNQRRMGGLGLAATAILFFVAPVVWFLWIPIAIWGWATLSKRDIDAGPFKAALSSAEGRVQSELDRLLGASEFIQAQTLHRDLKETISAYQSHDRRLSERLRDFRSRRKERQLQDFLDRFPIRAAQVSGVGQVKTATLLSFGIETAADVHWDTVLAVPGFGDVMTRRLVDWRRTKEARFKYNPNPTPQDATQEASIKAQAASERARLAQDIRDGWVRLNACRRSLDAVPLQAQSSPVLKEAVTARAQASQDLSIAGARPTGPRYSLPGPPPAQPKPIKRSTPQPRTRPSAATGSRRRSSGPGRPSCPRCGSAMRKKKGRYGYFWGCPRYPRCQGTRNI